MIIKNLDIDWGDLVRIKNIRDNEFVGFACKPFWLARLFNHKIALTSSKSQATGALWLRDPFPFKEKQIKEINILDQKDDTLPNKSP